jgi:hypothetical protein
MCSLRFKNNLLSSEGVRFASISKKTLLSKLLFAFVSLALPSLDGGSLLLVLGHQQVLPAKFSKPFQLTEQGRAGKVRLLHLYVQSCYVVAIATT